MQNLKQAMISLTGVGKPCRGMLNLQTDGIQGQGQAGLQFCVFWGERKGQWGGGGGGGIWAGWGWLVVTVVSSCMAQMGFLMGDF